MIHNYWGIPMTGITGVCDYVVTALRRLRYKIDSINISLHKNNKLTYVLSFMWVVLIY